ncbi:anthrone oxygenase family protein [Streptoverticillium reticulum]|uniref:anthrone oxygenase family protein n=1 Tax=Streptoverticillium reticulum TaxID=1433415 RepID=UPI0039BEDC6B
MFPVVVPLVVLANGLAAGVLTGTLLGGWPLLAALPPDRYVHAHAFFATRYDPFMPACMITTVLGDGALTAARTDAAPRALFLAGGVLALAAVVVSVTANVPVNKWVRTLDPDNLPADFDRMDPRPRWGAWNRRRAALTALALLANCTALALLL